MSIPNDARLETTPAVKWDEDLVFAALANRARRKLLAALASGAPQTATDLMHAGKARRGNCSAPWNFLHSTVKNLKVLIDAGMVVQLDNRQDRRRPLHALSPALKGERHGDDIVFDFGFFVARIDRDGN